MIADSMMPFANHLWQSTLFAVAVWVITLALRKNRAAVRHRLWLAASVKFLVPFSLLASLGSQFQWTTPVTAPPAVSRIAETISQPFSASSPSFVSPGVSPGGTDSFVSTPVAEPSRLPAVLAGVWIVGVAASLVWWFMRWQRVRQAVRLATPSSVSWPLRVMHSSERLEPGVFGIFRPVLLLPEGIADRLSRAQLQSVLAHEFCHVQRRDNLTMAIHMMVEALFWFHPCVWWIKARLLDEQETACDEEVLRLGSEPMVYAESLLKVCEFYVESPLICVSGVTGSDLKKRVGRIMRNEIGEALNRWRRVALVTAGIAALAVPVVVGLVDASPIPFQAAQTQIPFAPAQTATRRETPQTTPRPEAQPNIVGDYIGVVVPPPDEPMPPLYTRLRIRAAAGGKLNGTLESPDQRTIVPLTDVRVEGQSVSFPVPVVGGSWKGSIENDGARLNGTLTSTKGGPSVALVFTRETGQTQIPQTPTRPETPQTQSRPDAPPNTVRPADAPKWEVVSVRPCTPTRALGGGRGGPNSAPPGRFSADRMTLNCLLVRDLIRSAYHAYLPSEFEGEAYTLAVALIGGGNRRNPMEGAPDWVDTDRYTIEAKAEGVTDRALMQGPMLQAILEDRFKTRVHWETREAAVDALVIARGGSKLKPFVEGSCVRSPAGTPSWPGNSPFAPGRQRYCRIEGGGLNRNTNNGNQVNIVYDAEGVTIDEFIKRFLGGNRPRFVIDKTGLTGKFDIHLEAEISAETRQRFAAGDDPWVLGPSTAPPFPEALQQQLGLKLESTKGPVEYLVVDHIERPSPD